MSETAGQHKAGRLRQSPDEKPRELLRSDSKLLVTGPQARTYAVDRAYVDKVRKTERWTEMCEEFAQLARA